MTATVTTGFSRDAFDSFLATRNEPPWLRDQRAKAWTQYEALPLPSQKDEEWMRTDIRLLKLDRFGFPAERAAGATLPEGLLTHRVELGGQVTAWDSQPHSARLNEKWAHRGV